MGIHALVCGAAITKTAKRHRAVLLRSAVASNIGAGTDVFRLLLNVISDNRMSETTVFSAFDSYIFGSFRV